MKQLDDPTLMARMSHGDEAALGELYDRYGRLILSVAYNVVGDRATAEEITLDVFTRAWQKAHTYNVKKARVSTWLTRMTRNRAIDMLRREAVRPFQHSVSWSDLPVHPPSPGDNPEDAAHLALETQRIQAAMATLPTPQQEALALAYFQGLTHSEISQALDQPLGTVKARIRAGMQKLRAILVDK